MKIFHNTRSQQRQRQSTESAVGTLDSSGAGLVSMVQTRSMNKATEPMQTVKLSKRKRSCKAGEKGKKQSKKSKDAVAPKEKRKRNVLRDKDMNARAGGNGSRKSSKAAVPAKGTKQPALAGVTCPGTFGSSHVSSTGNPNLAVPETLPHPRGEIEADPHSYQMMGTADDIDEDDHNDPLSGTAYVEDMYSLFWEKEAITSARPAYIENQPHITKRMRCILVDWLIEVNFKFKVVPEVLYLTINLIDRYLQIKEVARQNLQLLGVTSFLIASKYEEIYPPEIRDLVHICDRAYTRTHIIEMEENILKTLTYKITIPSANAFLCRFLKAAHADKKIVHLSYFILDGTLLSYSLLHYLPSQLAAAAVFIARHTISRNTWSPTLLKYTGYCEEEIIPIARAVLNERGGTSAEHRALTKKYSSERHGRVASTVFQCNF